MKNGGRKYENRSGLTLFEVLMVMAISVLFIFVISGFKSNLDILQSFTSQKLQSKQDIEQTLQIMTTEVRSAAPSSAGAYPIDAASTSSFSFYSDIDKDGIFERVRYFLGTSTVQKGVVKPTGNPLTYSTSSEAITTAVNSVIVSSSTILFTYYDSNYTGSEAPMSYPLDVTKIRLLNVSMYVDVNTSSTPRPDLFTQTMDIRNLRSN